MDVLRFSYARVIGFFTVQIIDATCIPFSSVMAQLGNVFAKEYVIKQVYDANGNPIRENIGAPTKIKINIVTMFGSTLGYIPYNDMIGMYDPTPMTFEYRGDNNRWHIYGLDLGFMGGRSFVYVKNDLSLVRVCLSFYKSKFVEYRPYVEGEDINMTPTF